MVIHIDFAPIKECKHPEWTYGELCVKCGECGRFEKGGVSNPIRGDVKVISQFYESIPPLWQYPQEEATYYKGEWAKYRTSTGKREASKNLTDTIPQCWHNRGLDYVRWWIEGKNW